MPYSLLKIHTDPKKYNKQNINIYIYINWRWSYEPVITTEVCFTHEKCQVTQGKSRPQKHHLPFPCIGTPAGKSSNKMTIASRLGWGRTSRYQDMTRICQEMPVSNKSTVWSQLKALATVKCSSSLKSETSKGWMLNPGRFPCLSIVSTWGLPEQPSKASHLHMQKFEGPGRRGLLGLLLSVWLEPERPQVVMCSWPCCGFSVLCVVVAVGFMMLAVPGKFASILTHYTKNKMK